MSLFIKYGIYAQGGGIERLYMVDDSSDDYIELDIDTLAVLNTVSIGETSPRGIGGTKQRLFSSKEKC